jgi:hypothetical protein
MTNEDFKCPCSHEVKSIGACACDNMRINSECKAILIPPKKREIKSRIKPLDELKMTTKNPIRKTVYKKAKRIDLVNYLIKYHEDFKNSNP